MPESTEPKQDALVLADVAVGVTKVGISAIGLLSANPSVALLAAIAAEMTGALLERQKVRFTDFVGVLNRKLRSLPEPRKEQWQSRFEEDEGQQFFEDACNQAAQTVSPEKVEAIAALVKNSLSAKELRLHDARRLLQLLEELDPVEIILLQSYTKRYSDDTAFLEQHKAVFEGVMAPKAPHHSEHHALFDYGQPIQKEKTSEQEKQKQEYQMARELHAIYVNRTNHLVDIGLLGVSIMSGHRELELTALGTALLKIVDLADDDEWGLGEQTNVVQALRHADEESASLRQTIHDKEQQHQRDLQQAAKEFESEFKRGLESAARHYR